MNTPFRLTDHGIELLVTHHAGDGPVLIFDELGVAQDAGVVDQNVNAAPLCDYVPNGFIHRGGAGDVHRLKHPAFLGRSRPDVPGGDPTAFLREALRGGESDSGGSAGDDDYFGPSAMLPPDVADGESVGKRVLGIDDVLCEAGDPRLSRDGGTTARYGPTCVSSSRRPVNVVPRMPS